ncbi:hypothetical protein [Streptomyces beigongshangae]|uniref:hypothetical protein n=1 Tax=Streptomyces beigongshangae TaxID=2841597 RepID=UPI0027E100D6|nr:hypothetical protein [Streptomyces sp. REN17]
MTAGRTRGPRGRLDEAVRTAGQYGFARPFPAAVVFPDSQTVYGELLPARGVCATPPGARGSCT